MNILLSLLTFVSIIGSSALANTHTYEYQEGEINVRIIIREEPKRIPTLPHHWNEVPIGRNRTVNR